MTQLIMEWINEIREAKQNGDTESAVGTFILGLMVGVMVIAIVLTISVLTYQFTRPMLVLIVLAIGAYLLYKRL